MFVTLSFRKYAQLIREVENLEPGTTDEEVSVRLDYYSQRVWNHVANFGIKMIGLAESTPSVGAFQVSIAGVGQNWQTGGFDFEKLRSALNFLNPIAVTLEAIDMEWICSGPVATVMTDRFEEYAPTLQRIPVSEIESAVNNACQKYAWAPRTIFPEDSPSGGNPTLDALYFEQEATDQLERAGVRNPTERFEAAEEFKRREIEAYQDAEKARRQRIMDGSW